MGRGYDVDLQAVRDEVHGQRGPGDDRHAVPLRPLRQGMVVGVRGRRTDGQGSEPPALRLRRGVQS